MLCSRDFSVTLPVDMNSFWQDGGVHPGLLALQLG